jgi:hypothetical protein
MPELGYLFEEMQRQIVSKSAQTDNDTHAF